MPISLACCDTEMYTWKYEWQSIDLWKSSYLEEKMVRALRVMSQGNGRIAKIYCFIVQAIGLSLTTSQEKTQLFPWL